MDLSNFYKIYKHKLCYLHDFLVRTAQSAENIIFLNKSKTFLLTKTNSLCRFSIRLLSIMHRSVYYFHNKTCRLCVCWRASCICIHMSTRCLLKLSSIKNWNIDVSLRKVYDMKAFPCSCLTVFFPCLTVLLEVQGFTNCCPFNGF